MSLIKSNFLILITSCKKNLNKQEFQRSVFKNNFNYYFLIGDSKKNSLCGDILNLNVPDTYEMLHLKIVEAIKFFKGKYNILKIDDDTLVDTSRLIEFNFVFDYGGYIGTSGKGSYNYHCEKVQDKRFSSEIDSDLVYKFAYGGGYFLSEKAQKIFLKNFKHSEEYSNHLKLLKGREDRLVGQTLFPFTNKLFIENCGYRFFPDDGDDHSFSAFNDSLFHPVKEKDFDLYKDKKFIKYTFYKNLINSRNEQYLKNT